MADAIESSIATGQTYIVDGGVDCRLATATRITLKSLVIDYAINY